MVASPLPSCFVVRSCRRAPATTHPPTAVGNGGSEGLLNDARHGLANRGSLTPRPGSSRDRRRTLGLHEEERDGAHWESAHGYVRADPCSWGASRAATARLDVCVSSQASVGGLAPWPGGRRSIGLAAVRTWPSRARKTEAPLRLVQQDHGEQGEREDADHDEGVVAQGGVRGREAVGEAGSASSACQPSLTRTGHGCPRRRGGRTRRRRSASPQSAASPVDIRARPHATMQPPGCSVEALIAAGEHAAGRESTSRPTRTAPAASRRSRWRRRRGVAPATRTVRSSPGGRHRRAAPVAVCAWAGRQVSGHHRRPAPRKNENGSGAIMRP